MRRIDLHLMKKPHFCLFLAHPTPQPFFESSFSLFSLVTVVPYTFSCRIFKTFFDHNFC